MSLRNHFEELVDLHPEARSARMKELRLSTQDAIVLAGMLAFDQLSTLPESLRASELDAMALSPAITDKVRGMLHADGVAPILLRNTAKQVIHHIESDDSSDSTVRDDLVGHVVGSFRITAFLAEGGSSVVFRAEREVGDGSQQVALKLLRTGLFSKSARRRFRREQAILAQLTHPNIARLIEGGVSAAGVPYIAMELVEGLPIHRAANARALDIRGRLTLFLTLCRTIEAAHASLIVHRDIKPSNILITDKGGLKVLDFGIAKLVADQDSEHPQTSTISLTPEYAAPEQYRSMPVTTAVDVYALGMVLGELLTGRRLSKVTRASSALASGKGPDPLPTQGLPTRAALARELRGDLDAILAMAVAENPKARYPTAAALGDDIERYLSGLPVHAHPLSHWYLARKFAIRHRGPIAIAAGLAFVCIAAAVISLQQARSARDQASRAQAAQDFLVGVFQQSNPDENKGAAITAQQLLERGQAQLAGGALRQPAVHADLTGLIGSLYWTIGDYARGQPLLEQAVATSADSRVPAEIKARNLLRLAETELNKRSFAAARRHVDEALKWALQAGREGEIEAANARRALATILTEQGHAKDAEQPLRAALESDIDRHGLLSDVVVQDLTMLGRSLDELARYDEGQDVLQRAVNVARALHGDVHTSVCNAQSALGLLLGHKGAFAEAEEPLRAAVAAYKQLYGNGHRDTLMAESNLLRVLENQGRFAEALEGRLKLLPATAALREERPEQLAFLYNFLANDYRSVGRLEEARQASLDSLAVWAEIQGNNEGWDSADPMRGLAQTLQLQGLYAEAERAYRTALAIQAAREPADSRWLNRDRGYLGDLLRLQHRYAEAVHELRSAAEAVKASPGDSDPILTGMQSALAEAELDNGDPATAKIIATRALGMGRAALPPGNYRFGTLLFVLARCELALQRPAAALPLLREAVSVRSPLFPADDPRMLEVNVSLAAALAALGKIEESHALMDRVEPLLSASSSPYATDLRARLPAR